ncbi:hypothetical protein MXB_5530 [Myxobolus squamalis]|nr:hypothetical protein MXB_5530 [Myxobolus squamalis]
MQTQNNDIQTVSQRESSSPAPNSKETISAQFKYLRELIKSTFDSKFGEIFRAPVEPERDNVPNYFDVITSPIDLGTILSKLDKNEYNDPEDCIADFKLMIDNCNTFNPEGSVAQYQARELDKLFNKKMIKYPIEVPVVVAPLKRRNTSLSPNKVDESKSDDYKLKSNKIKKIACDKNQSVNIPLASKDNSRHSRKPTKDFGGSDKDYALPFLSAVDPISLGIPDYFDIIKCPMDLGTVREVFEHFIAICPQDVYYDMFIGHASEQTMIVSSVISRGTRRSQNVESRQIMDCFQSIDRKLQQIADDVVKIKQEKPAKFMPYSENGQLPTKKPSQKSASSSSLTPLKNPSLHSLFPRIEPQKVDDADPMTYDEKLALSSQIMCLTGLLEPKIKEVIGIIHQKEPWSRRSSQGKDKNNIEFDLESLQPSTLRGLNRKKSENSYRKKCTVQERISREQDLRKKLQDMESQLSGKTPIPIGDESTGRLSDSSSESDISDDDFSKRYSLIKPVSANQSSSTLHQKTAEIQKVPIDSARTAALTQNSFLAKLGITTTSHSPKSSTNQESSIQTPLNSKFPNPVQIEQLREEERKKRLLHIGKIDINAQGDIMKTFEDKF